MEQQHRKITLHRHKNGVYLYGSDIIYIYRGEISYNGLKFNMTHIYIINSFIHTRNIISMYL